MQLWYSLVNFSFVNKEICLQYNQIKGVIWFKMDVVTKQHNIFIKCNWFRIWKPSIKYNLELFPKWPIYIYIYILWLIESRSFRQKEQVMSVSIPICARTTFVAIILCTSLIWNHFSFISWICCIFLKVIRHLVSLFSVASHLSQQLGLFILCVSTS